MLCLRETPVWGSGLRQPPAFPRLFFLRPLELLLGIALHIYVAVCSRPSPRNGIALTPPFPVVPLHGERLTGGCQTLMLRAPESVPPLAGAGSASQRSFARRPRPPRPRERPDSRPRAHPAAPPTDPGAPAVGGARRPFPLLTMGRFLLSVFPTQPFLWCTPSMMSGV